MRENFIRPVSSPCEGRCVALWRALQVLLGQGTAAGFAAHRAIATVDAAAGCGAVMASGRADDGAPSRRRRISGSGPAAGTEPRSPECIAPPPPAASTMLQVRPSFGNMRAQVTLRSQYEACCRPDAKIDSAAAKTVVRQNCTPHLDGIVAAVVVLVHRLEPARVVVRVAYDVDVLGRGFLPVCAFGADPNTGYSGAGGVRDAQFRGGGRGAGGASIVLCSGMEIQTIPRTSARSYCTICSARHTTP